MSGINVVRIPIGAVYICAVFNQKLCYIVVSSCKFVIYLAFITLAAVMDKKCFFSLGSRIVVAVILVCGAVDRGAVF